MTTIYDIYLLSQFITDKARNGFITPEEFSIALDAGQQAAYGFYWERYGKEQTATDALAPFSKSLTTASGVNGMIPYPADYGHVLGVYKFVNGKARRIDQVLHTELPDALESVLYPVTYEKPIMLPEDTGIQLYPQQVIGVQFHYLSRPTTPVLGYTISGNAIAYDANASIQLQFKNNYWNDILLRSLPYLGVNLSDQDVFALSAQFAPKPIINGN